MPFRNRRRTIQQAGVYPLGGEPSDDLGGSTTASERVAMVWPLTLEAWKLTGSALPEYPRDRMPGRVLARDDTTSPPGE